MLTLRRNSQRLVMFFSLVGIVSLPGCGEKPPPPVEIEEIDFEEATKEATKEYGGGM